MGNNNRLLIFLTMLVSGCLQMHVSLAQWKAVYYRTAITDTMYDISTDNSLSKSSEYPFPEYFYFYNINSIKSSVDCSKPYAIAEGTLLPLTDKEEIPVLYRTFSKPVHVQPDTTVISHRLYTDNILRYNIYFYNAQQQQWFKKTSQPTFQGFQQPVTTFIDEWQRVPGVQTASNTDQVLISVLPRDIGRPWKFTVGCFILGNQISSQYTVRHPFFKALPVPSLFHRESAASFRDTVWSDYFEELPAELSARSLPAKIYIKPAGNQQANFQDRTLLKTILTACLDHYPFYAERQLSKENVKKELNAIFQQADSYCSLVDTLSRYIALKFNDMHFYIEKAARGECPVSVKASAKSPIRLVDINNRYFVAANFDTAFYPIHLNDEVLAINGIPVKQVFDSIAKARYGDNAITSLKKEQIISTILDRDTADSCYLSVRHDSAIYTETATIHYNRKYNIPANFRAVQCEYVKYPGNVSYFKINAWEPIVYLQFVNHLEEFQQSSSIIIDLRGNGGGELVTAMQLFSAFISHPTSYFHFIAGNEKLESVAILPQKGYSISPSVPVIILGDAVTACASETFIKAMQQRGNVRFIATSGTVGTVAAKYDIIFPSGIIIHTNGIERKTCYRTPEDVIETHGIQPDIKVAINRVEDLRPYNDKLLKEAFKYLSADNGNSRKPYNRVGIH